MPHPKKFTHSCRNTNNIVVFDFETWSLDPLKLEPVSLAAKVIDPATLQWVPGPEAEFYSLMRPVDMNNFDPKVIEINGLTAEKVEDAPQQEVVWKSFADFVRRFHKGNTSSDYGAPLPAGKNIITFDLLIAKRLARTYKTGILFNNRRAVDLEHYLWEWFEGTDELENFKMDTIRPYFGFPKQETHNALTDVQETGLLLMHFMKLHRTLKARVLTNGKPMICFKDAFGRPKAEEVAA